MKVEIKREEAKSVVMLKDMDIGQIGISRVVGFDGEIVLKIYGHLVSLTNPGNIWGEDALPGQGVELLPPGTRVILTVEE